MLARALLLASTFVLSLALPLAAQADRDTDRDGLPDFQETHKYRTDPTKADTDGDGVPDGDWRERREHQYTIRTVIQVMRPVTIEWLCDDHQDTRVLDETAEHVELEVIHYPLTSVAAAVTADAGWRATAARMAEWTAPGVTADWAPAMQQALVAALAKEGIDAKALDDKTLVERASRWLCAHAKQHDAFTTFVTAFDAKGRPFVPRELAAAVPADAATLAAQWSRDVSARGMFEQGLRGSCSSSAIYLNGCLRALGVPTRIVLCVPLVDANDAAELAMAERGITHHGVRAKVLPALRALQGKWASHSFNEVFVGGRWRRLNYERLGQDTLDPGALGLMTHVATFHDWADARMSETIGKRQALRRYGDTFGHANPYSTIALRDEFGAHCKLANEAPPLPAGRITKVQWGDGAATDAEVRAWFAAERERFGLVARVEGPSSADELRQLLATSDPRVLLVADGLPTLGVDLAAGTWWWRGDHALVVVRFGAADRADHVAAKSYRFVLRNQPGKPAWQLAAGVLVPARE